MGKGKRLTDKQLVKIATDFRAGILDGHPSTMMCFAICAPLAGLLRCYGLETEMVESDLGECNHFWLRLPDGRALDPTADQFNDYGFPPMPPVYLGPPATLHPAPTPSKE